MKMLLVLLPALLGLASAQTYSCECALFLQDQVILGQNPLPLEYLGSEVESADICDQDPMQNRCRQYCRRQFDENVIASDIDYCTQNQAASRCYGAMYCEILNNQDWTNVANGIVREFGRVRGCPGEIGNWMDMGRRVNDTLCCNSALFQKCNGQECVPSCVEQQLCDCGLFAESQFDLVKPGITPLPLVGLGIELGDTTECEGWPSADFKHTCDQKCSFVSTDFITNNKLDDEYPNNNALTWGDAMCNMLYGKWYDQWPVGGVNEQLQGRGRMPICGNPQWSERIYDIHEQRLCCDTDGLWEWCPVQ